MLPLNEWRISRTAPVERESGRIETNNQNSYDLARRLRRRLEALVARPP
jgi:hypothetical protein